MKRLGPTLASVAVLAAVIAPVFPPGGDSFPLSIYPMYARQRDDVITVHTALGVSADGALTRLSTTQIADTDDPLVATTTIRDALRSGADAAARQCEEILQRSPEAAAVLLVVERRDAVEAVRSKAVIDDRLIDERHRCDR